MRFQFGAALAVSLATGAHAVPLTIDDFSSDQLVQAISAVSASQLADTSVSGGFRDMGVISDTGEVNSSELSITGGALRYSTIAGTSGTGFLTYDGDDAPDSVNTTGLGGFDLTDGGIADRVLMDVASLNGPVPLRLNIWDMVGGFSTLSTSITAPGSLSVLFSDLSGDGGLTNLGALQFVFGGNGIAGQSIAINSIVATDGGGAAVVPLPASGVLLGALFLVAAGASARMRRNG